MDVDCGLGEAIVVDYLPDLDAVDGYCDLEGVETGDWWVEDEADVVGMVCWCIS